MKKRYTHVYVTYVDLCDPENDSDYPYACGSVRTFDLSKGSAIVDLGVFLKGLSKDVTVTPEDSNDKEPSKVWDSSLREGNGDWALREGGKKKTKRRD